MGTLRNAEFKGNERDSGMFGFKKKNDYSKANAHLIEDYEDWLQDSFDGFKNILMI